MKEYLDNGCNSCGTNDCTCIGGDNFIGPAIKHVIWMLVKTDDT